MLQVGFRELLGLSANDDELRDEHEDAMRRAGERFEALRGDRRPPEPPVARARHRRRR